MKRNNHLILVLIIIIIILLLLLCLKSCEKEPDLPVIDPNAGAIEDDKDKNDTKHDDVVIMGISQIKISKDCTDVVLNYKNPEKNDGKYYISISIMLKDNKEVLYQSNLIPPGKGIKYASLSRPLEEGIYSAILHVQPYKMNDLSKTNNADLEIKLIVE